MPQGRKAIPAALRRRVLVEAGHSCAVSTCRQTPVEIAHIDPWSKVKEHRFENLIALCPNCHTRFDAKQIDRKAMRQYKSLLSRGTKYQEAVDSRLSEIEEKIETTPTVEIARNSSVVANFLGRCCEVGFRDRARFITVGICTFVKPQTAIVPQKVLNLIEGILKRRGDEGVVFHPIGLSPYSVVTAGKDETEMAVITIEAVETEWLEELLSRTPEEARPYVRSEFEINDSVIPVIPMLHIGDEVGMIIAPQNSKDRRQSISMQYQSSVVSFKANMEDYSFLCGYLEPIPTVLDYAGSPVFHKDGTLAACVIDVVTIEGELGWRPVFGSVINVSEIWKPFWPPQKD